MKKLSKNMVLSVKKIYADKTCENIKKSTLNALIERGIVDHSNQLTDYGIQYAISTMPLVKQCSEMSLDYEVIKISYDGKPEPAVLSYYNTLGYVGVSCEGTGVFTVLKALMLDKLTEYNYFNEREDACTRYLEAQLTILKDKTDELISEISSVNKSKYLSNFHEIISKPFIENYHPGLSLEFAEAMFDAINKNTYIAVAKKIAENPYAYRSGWPDLTLVKGRDVLFVEVKTTDKLHESQLFTIPIMREILPFKFSVCRVMK